MPSLEQVRDQLESEAGVSPSIRWLDQCVRHIRGHNGNNDVISSSNNPSNSNNIIDQAETESIWDQIRHSDLRNVIREPSSSDNNSNIAAETGINTAATMPAMQLRQAISQSKMNSNNSNAANNSNSSNNSRNKAVLPQNFQLMIQLEEVVDGSQNSEQRIASMGGNCGGNSLIASSSNNSNQYNNNNNNKNRSEKWRSLKMVFSDGYYSNGRRTYNDNNNNNDDDQENNVLYAMEISPITNLSTASVPGTKILLHGPITIRHGMLQLNDENAFVIGGQVPSWREIWTKAREKALREGGVGVDPTIKALIWNPLMGNEEEVDEGEGESGDVTAPRAPPPQQQQPPPPGGGQSHTTLPVITPNHSMENRTQSHHQRGSSNVTNTTTTARNNNINPTGATNMNNAATSRRENFRQTTLDSYPKQNRTVTAAAATTAATTAATAAAVTSNPYQQRSSYQNNSTNQQSSQQQQQQRQTANPYASTNQQQQQQQLPKTNPYASLRQNMTDQSNSSTAASTMTSNPSNSGISSNQDDAIDLTESPANVSARMMDTTSTSDTPQQVAISSKNSTPNATNNNISSSKPLSGNLSFSEFKSLMQSLRHNRVLYEQYYGKEIVVLCKISSGSENKVFNIVKDGGGSGDKKSKGKKEKKYKFFLVSNFYGPKQSDGSIVCQVESALMEPFFQGYSPAEVRKLSREDKARAARIVEQSSTSFLHELSSMGQVHIELMLAADEFFEKISSMPSDAWLEDAKNPLLLVVKRTSF